ncbi:MAG: peptide chain release factor 1 [Candidatus Wallbacteria bacterium GWC2_49_35]|uniref:Peptide chain release factor 1 n=1 Tax=Candidatus Wallbacteria bacterium GWC2_49_35 TaxID=1817813 RepID=A0A1F7WLM1_9BACT|nr:MAG: peptide chain release factor 1 [Candidatus Wallbacteria bacterium GWC2_49_35]
MFELYNKLEEIEKKYNELENQLADPEIIKNQSEFTKVSRTRSGLEETVACFREYQRLLKDINDNERLLETEKDTDILAMAAEELLALKAKTDGYEDRLKILLLPRDPNDDKNTIVEIRAGAGGEEASLFAATLFRMYSRYAENRGWKCDVIDSHSSEKGGMKEIIFSITGEKVYSKIKYESGVHRVQRVPITEASGRIHTSTATVAVLPEAEEVDIAINANDLRVDTFCSTGPGGQSVNTTYSAIRITHIPTGLVVQCQDEKSQIKNKAKAMKVLRTRMLEAEQQKQSDQIAQDRRSQVGTGDRSERIRTYNYPQNRITDHRINLTLGNLTGFLDGDIEEMLQGLTVYDQTEKLKKIS